MLRGLSDFLMMIRVIAGETCNYGPSHDKDISKAIPMPDLRTIRRALRRKKRWIVLFCALQVPRAAVAQEPEVQTPVDLFEAESGDGVRISPGLVAFARADAVFFYDTNVYNEELAKLEDTIFVASPSFSIQTDLPRHGARLSVDSEIRRHFDLTAEDSEVFDAEAAGWLELGERFEVNGLVGYGRQIEKRGTAGDVFDTDRPVEYEVKRASLGIGRTGGKLEMQSTLSILDQQYEDATIGGSPVDLSFRDVTLSKFTLRFDYQLSTKIKAFAEGSRNSVDYDQDVPSNRDSDGFAAIAGLKYQATALVDVEAAAGFLKQNFDDPTIDSAEGINFWIKANWTPQPQWKFTALGSRQVDPSPLSNVPAIIRSNFSLKAQRALNDRYLVEASGSFVSEDYRTVARTDDRYGAELRVRYRLSNNIGTSVFAGYRKQDSPAFGESYSGVAVGVSLSALL